MNNKGYTLIEILMVVAIIAVLGLTATVGLNKVILNSKQNKYDQMISEIKEAANVYITIIEPDLNASLYVDINETVTIEELQTALLLDENLKNPKDNSLVSGNVVITYNSSSESISYDINLD